jgi:hypothetical protein
LLLLLLMLLQCPGGCPHWNDTTATVDNVEFVCKFFEKFPELQGNDFYIVGESAWTYHHTCCVVVCSAPPCARAGYAGVFIPLTALGLQSTTCSFGKVNLKYRVANNPICTWPMRADSGASLSETAARAPTWAPALPSEESTRFSSSPSKVRRASAKVLICVFRLRHVSLPPSCNNNCCYDSYGCSGFFSQETYSRVQTECADSHGLTSPSVSCQSALLTASDEVCVVCSPTRPPPPGHFSRA